MNTKKVLSLMLVSAIAASSFAPVAQATRTNTSVNPNTVSAQKPDMKRNVMYYADWAIWGGQGNHYPKDLPAGLYTHLNYAFMDFTASGELVFTDKDAALDASLGQPGVTWGDVNAGLFPALRSVRAENPNMKLGISVGGWSKSGDFSDMAANDASRANFVKNICAFLNYTGMDFIDIDWEYPNSVRQPDLVDNKNDEGTPNARPEDKENYIKLLEDLRVALDKQGDELGKTYEISVALPIDMRKLEAGVDVQRMFEIIDFGNMMTYDARGAFDATSGHQTPLYGNPADPQYELGFSIDQSIDYMLSQGAPADKLIVGAAFYTRGWESVENTEIVDGLPGLYADAAVAGKDADQTPSRGASNDSPLTNGDAGRRSGVWAYRNRAKLDAAYPGLVEYWDDVAKAPYLYNGSAFFTYDNARSITEKTNYVNENNLGGMITWMSSNDATTTSTVRDELTKVIYDGLYGSAELPDHEIIEGDLDLDVKVSTYKESWAGSGYEITITNNEKADAQGTVLKGVELQKESVLLPKLYIDNSGIPLMTGGYGSGTVTNKGDLTEVDLSSVYEGKVLKQGQSMTIKVKYSGSQELDVKNLKSIKLVQRTTTTGPEIAPQVIYGSESEESVNTPPTFIGTGNKTVEFGADFDAFEGVAAMDKEDGDLTAAIKVTGSVNTNKAGEYTLTYTVEDSEGEVATAKRVITVLEKVVTPEPEANTAPTISGTKNQTIEFGSSFNALAGVTATDKEDGDLTDSIKVTGTVNTNKAGRYTITYTVADSKGLTASKTVVITVSEKEVTPEPETNTAPVISGTKNQTIKFGSSFNALAGVTATDKEDGNLTHAIKVTGSVNTNKAGKYTITYTVADSKGLTASKSVVITVLEKVVTPEPETNTAPVISGTKNQTIKFGSSFNALAGVTATDKEDGNLTHAIKVTGSVNTNKAGKYTITYTVADSKGLTASKTVVITVLEKETVKPEGDYPIWNRPDAQKGKYTSGVIVSHKGVIYKQISNGTAWWSEPGTDKSTWQAIGQDDSYVAPAPIPWNQADAPKGVYTPGILVTYKGQTYKQISSGTAWWCAPGTDSSVWQLQ